MQLGVADVGIELSLAGWLFATAIVTALVGLFLLSLLQPAQRGPATGLFAGSGDETDFLFDGETLVDATPAARALLPHSPMRAGPAWPRLSAWLAPRFPGLGDALARLPAEGRITLTSAAGAGAPVMLLAEHLGGLTRIRLTDPEIAVAPQGGLVADRALQEELDILRAATAAAPFPIWRETAAGGVIWANTAYLDLVLLRSGDDDLTWPLPHLFDQSPPEGRHRARLDLPNAAGGRWFDLISHADGAARQVFALPADTAVQAEAALQGFMQTLAKTFAHLPIALAIFDQSRKLALFNPALIDLTTLPPEFLAARPSLAAFFDAMRDRSMLPEPRDYREWRRRMVEMEAAAATGQYEDTWSLPGGQTYHVTGRPHPNGALALMIEDISSEMSQTRRYRADLELGQAVIDAMDEAIAVFAASGTLVMSNAAYSALWGHDPAGTLDGGATMAALCDHWRGQTAPTTVWDRAEDFVAAIAPQDGWGAEVAMRDGRAIQYRMARLAGGATLVGFRPAPASVTATAPGFASSRRSA